MHTLCTNNKMGTIMNSMMKSVFKTARWLLYVLEIFSIATYIAIAI